ncbi:MAG: bifunctional phosphopantothenoylcysteine decarboxylase/phosphopantothenate--cysteine ligase CoaBC [bacterium]|nr:bifunctional phosphopantothenoylcysteine decarboxylase/phosphopantothenate--cysteine ligase CoaBC [bacterium]
MKKTVVLGITSGIAAYKMLDFLRLLKKEDVAIEVVMTAQAEKIVHPKDIERVTGKKVYTDLFEEGFDYKNILKVRKVDHIDLADRADVIVIAPATANVIAKLAHGIADDFLTTMVLASNSPIVLSPSMNVHMWNNPVTKENIATLKKLGFIIIPPERGLLACGYEGPGRLPHLEKIRDEVLHQSAKSKELTGRTVLVTAGATIEKIDDVRFITNKSSGKMGAALADECQLRGAKVILIRARNAVEPRYVMEQETFETFEELEKLVKKYIKSTDVMFHTAAVGDFSAKQKRYGKTKSNASFALHFTPQKKLSNEIKTLNPKIKLIVFKAEWGFSEKELVNRAKKKLLESRAESIVANDISQSDRGFAADENEVMIVKKNGDVKKINLASKQKIAKEIVDVVLRY